MVVSDELVRRAVVELASVRGVQMNADALVEDVYLMAYAFPEDEEFACAVASTRRALAQLAEGRVAPASLRYNFEGWSSYHYQHRVAQGTRANMRILFARVPGGIRVKGIGHRRVPRDFYRRMAETR